MTGFSLTVDLPCRWRLEGGASGAGFDVQLRRLAPPRPAAPAPAPIPEPATRPAPKPATEPIGGGSLIDAERPGYGFAGPRWSPLDEGNADP